MHEPVPEFVVEQLGQLELSVSEEQLELLSRYLDLLLEVNQTMNLTAIRDRDAAWGRLIIDSLTALPGLDPLGPGGRVIDIGTGGGLPGIPLAIARPDLGVTLLEATGKKVRFLQRCVNELLLANVEAVQERAEVAGHDPRHRQKYDVAISRAVGSVSEVLEYSLPMVQVGGRVLAMKGPAAAAELERAGDAMALLGGGDVQVFDAYPESFGQELVIISVVKDRATPRTYPRKPGVPKQSPL